MPWSQTGRITLLNNIADGDWWVCGPKAPLGQGQIAYPFTQWHCAMCPLPLQQCLSKLSLLPRPVQDLKEQKAKMIFLVIVLTQSPALSSSLMCSPNPHTRIRYMKLPWYYRFIIVLALFSFFFKLCSNVFIAGCVHDSTLASDSLLDTVVTLPLVVSVFPILNSIYMSPSKSNNLI